MIKVENNHIMRDGVKIGWVDGSHIFDHMAKKLGYIADNSVWSESAKKLAHLDGEYIYYPDTDKRVRLEEIIDTVPSATLSNIQRVAVRIFFGN